MQLFVRTSPHLHHHDSTARIMWSVVAALAPAFVGALYIFGYRAGVVTLACVLSCIVFEAVIQKLRKVPVTVGDGSAAVTGVLLAFVLPPDVPLWTVVLGAFIAIGLAKQLFGGLGCNIWNPALVARAVLQVSAPDIIGHVKWPILRGIEGGGFQWSRFAMDIRDQVAGNTHIPDAITMATPLSVSSHVGIMSEKLVYNPSLGVPHAYGWQMWLGFHPGCLGETSFILLAIGGIALILLKRVRWQIPAFYIGTVALLTWMLPYGRPGYEAPAGLFQGDPLYHIAFGGLALGAFFMATDMVTSPLTARGRAIFAVGCGIITACIRLYGGYPEGVCYAILIMNTAVPLIDRWTRPRVLGTGGARP